MVKLHCCFLEYKKNRTHWENSLSLPEAGQNKNKKMLLDLLNNNIIFLCFQIIIPEKKCCVGRLLFDCFKQVFNGV